jgi:CheY-like chemotaxis protein
VLLKNKRLFLVEDDLANRAIIQFLLEKHGARTSIERWGTDTVARLRAFMPIDLILLDLMFPNGVTGFEVFVAIRQQAEFATIPIVAISAMDPVLASPQCRDYGFNGFIAKPVEYELFADQVAALLNGQAVWEWGRQPMIGNL